MRHQHAMEAHMNKSFANFADLASFIAAETGNQDRSSIYEGAFMEHDERAKLSPVDETEQLEMPDPEQARAAVEMVMATLFDVFRSEEHTSELQSLMSISSAVFCLTKTKSRYQQESLIGDEESTNNS